MEAKHMTLRVQIERLKEFLLEKGYSPRSVGYYSQCWNSLLDYAALINIDTFSQELCTNYLYEQHGIDLSLPTFGRNNRYVRGIRILESFVLNSDVAEYSRRAATAPTSFLEVAESYISHLHSLGQTHPSVKSKRSRVKQFLNYLESLGMWAITDITKNDVIGFMSYLTTKYSSNARSNVLYTVKDFLLFCEAEALTVGTLSALIKGIYTNPNETLPSIYTAKEIAHLLQSVDRSSAGGKKQYAILVLAAQLGIRSSDIISLTLNNIKWDQNVIEFYQRKTGIFVKLPLVDNVKYALLDYLKNSRPDTKYPQLLVRNRAPIAPYKESSIIYAVISKQLALAGILAAGKRHGPHSLRHSMASGLLEEETPLPVIAAALGHNNTKNTSRYLRIDIERLREIALEVSV